jgi:PPOX class probable F420-dependent enzyme
MKFPEKFLDLFKPETKAILFLATVNANGTPQLSPVWFDADENHILINTNEGRLKDQNMKSRPNQITMVIQDPNDPYRYLGIKGKVVSSTTKGADEHINILSLRYDNKTWKYREDQKRIIFKIEPIRFDEHN